MANAARNVDWARRIDHALVVVSATPAQVERCCQAAGHYGFAQLSTSIPRRRAKLLEKRATIPV